VALGFVAGLPAFDVRRKLAEGGILSFDDPASAIRALAWLRARGALAREAPAHGAAPSPGHPTDPPADLSWDSLAAILGGFGIASAPSRIVTSEVVAAVAELGLPLAAKLPVDEAAHKTELGGVHLGLESVDEVREAVAALAELPGRRSQRVHLQVMLVGGVEVLAAVRRDPDIGPVLSVGPGGVLVELVAGLAHRLLPASERSLAEAVAETRLEPLLDGFRTAAPADKPALVAALAALAQLLLATPWIRELEINPLIVLPRGRGAYAVDVAVEAIAES
jgi:acyl-CoA synthetase (NDP forming)